MTQDPEPAPASPASEGPHHPDSEAEHRTGCLRLGGGFVGGPPSASVGEHFRPTAREDVIRESQADRLLATRFGTWAIGYSEGLVDETMRLRDGDGREWANRGDCPGRSPAGTRLAVQIDGPERPGKAARVGGRRPPRSVRTATTGATHGVRAVVPLSSTRRSA